MNTEFSKASYGANGTTQIVPCRKGKSQKYASACIIVHVVARCKLRHDGLTYGGIRDIGQISFTWKETCKYNKLSYCIGAALPFSNVGGYM